MWLHPSPFSPRLDRDRLRNRLLDSNSYSTDISSELHIFDFRNQGASIPPAKASSLILVTVVITSTTEYDGSLHHNFSVGCHKTAPRAQGPLCRIGSWTATPMIGVAVSSTSSQDWHMAFDRHAAPPLPVTCPRLKDDGNRRRRSCLCLAVANSLRTTRVSNFVIQFYFEIYFGAR